MVVYVIEKFDAGRWTHARRGSNNKGSKMIYATKKEADYVVSVLGAGYRATRVED